MTFLRNIFVAVMCVGFSMQAMALCTVKVLKNPNGSAFPGINVSIGNLSTTTDNAGLARFHKLKQGDCKGKNACAKDPTGKYADACQKFTDGSGYKEVRLSLKQATPAKTTQPAKPTVSATASDFAPIGSCIDNKGKWITGACRSTNTNTKTAKCKPNVAAKDSVWTKYQGYELILKNGSQVKMPNPNGNNIYRCTAESCNDGYEIRQGWCQKKKDAPAATTPAPVSENTDAAQGCTLEFKPNGNRLTKLEGMIYGAQYGCEVGDATCTGPKGAWTYFVEDEDKDMVPDNPKSPLIKDLIKVNGVAVDASKYFENALDVVFSCEKEYQGEYFSVLNCLDGYHGENVVYHIAESDLDYFDKCVKDAPKIEEEPELEDCSLAELDKLHASSGEKPVGGECVAMMCATGYHFQEPEKVICVPDEAPASGENPADAGDAPAADAAPGADAPSDNGSSTTPAPTKAPDNAQEIADAEQAYDDAYENEHSFANRMISGVSMAATGIGGMELAQGLAEQSSDAAAAADMQQYLATFQCRIGDAGGKSYSGGDKGIEVSGSNTLAPLYQQYVDLASDLKERKTNLGMAPGLESAVVMDKANMGLYDDGGGSGIENGTYASLYRASKGNATDQQKLAEQADSSATRVKAGAIAAAGGVAVGIAGNVLNNYVGKDNKDSKDKKSKSTVDKIKDAVGDVGGDNPLNNIIPGAGNDNADANNSNADDAAAGGDDNSENTSDDEVAKLKECLNYIQNPDTFNFIILADGCVKLAIPMAGDDAWYVLNQDEAASLSPVWNWNCLNADPDAAPDKIWLYSGGDRDYSEIADEEKDACETVEKVKAFIAEHTKSCEEYENRTIYTENIEGLDPVKYCVQKDWQNAENADQPAEDQPTESSIKTKADCKKKANHHKICTKSDEEICGRSDHAVKTWIYNGKCIPQDLKDENPCEEGYKLARKNNVSQGYCMKGK